jgi:hypothetical protein
MASPGYLTPSSAPAFGAALARQFWADHARGRYGSDGVFRHGLSISLAGAAAPPLPAAPHFALHTLTMHGTGPGGRPDTGDEVLVFNADDCSRFGDSFEAVSSFSHGVAKFSVPAGHYWAVGSFLASIRNGIRLVSRIVVNPQFTVRGSAQAGVDARAATSKITFSTPRPATVQTVNFALRRTSPAGPSATVTWAISSFHVTTLVSPVRRRPAVGGLRSFAAAGLTSPPGPGVPYAYNVAVAGAPGLIGNQHYIIRPSALATVRERYFQDRASAGSSDTFGGFLAQQGLPADNPAPLRLPGRQIQYFSAGPDIIWNSGYSAGRLGAVTGGQFGVARTSALARCSPRTGTVIRSTPVPRPCRPAPRRRTRFGLGWR